jgi:hypothetical protein
VRVGVEVGVVVDGDVGCCDADAVRDVCAVGEVDAGFFGDLVETANFVVSTIS